MSTHRPEPPRLAKSLLRICCTRAYLEEIEGDLHELFTRRAERQGLARARRRYALDVASVCVRQLSARVVRALQRTARVRRILGVVGLLLAMAVVLLSNEQRWAIVTGYAILIALGVLEVLVYAASAFAILKALVRPARRRK
ncbi:MAG TPA: permease prefix domain 2-containing transporter [Polyangiales bacterium]|nr:permease prefix domain 2-containing transporter [Polyangiales bacterium]